MVKEFVKQYIMNLSSQDIEKIQTYANQNQITLTTDQAYQLLRLVQKNCQNLLNGIYQPTFQEITKIVDWNTAKKIESIYLQNIHKINEF